MIERQIAPGSLAPKKSNTGMMIGIAAAIVIVLGLTAFFIMRNKQSAAPTAVPSTASVTATAPPTSAPVAGGQGALLLSASPWGELETIVDDKGNPIDLSGEKKDTPTRIELEPGHYMVTVAGPNGTKQTVPVDIEAGKRSRKVIKTGDVNFEELEKEFAKP
jgi:hypothetical protein